MKYVEILENIDGKQKYKLKEDILKRCDTLKFLNIYLTKCAIETGVENPNKEAIFNPEAVLRRGNINQVFTDGMLYQVEFEVVSENIIDPYLSKIRYKTW